jgi:hypothetical protein
VTAWGGILSGRLAAKTFDVVLLTGGNFLVIAAAGRRSRGAFNESFAHDTRLQNNMITAPRGWLRPSTIETKE